jgi:hypothetical protein
MTQTITKPTYSIPPLENGDRLTRWEIVEIAASIKTLSNN